MSKNKPSWRKYTLATVIPFILITAALLYIYFTQEQGPAQASEKIIRGAAAKILNKDPNKLTDGDFTQIVTLSLEFGCRTEAPYLKDTFDIKFLKKFTNLKKLSLTYIRYPEKSLTGWKNILVKIHILNPRERVSIDLRPLEKIPDLQELSINFAQVKSIKPLAKLINLNFLALNPTRISDLGPLKGLTNMKYLYLINSNVSSLKPISNLTKLRELKLTNSNVSDITPLKEMTNLELLDLGGTKVTDLKPLRKLVNLKRLGLYKTGVSNVEPLSDLINLRDLCLSETQIRNEDLNVLKKLSNLTVLYLTGTQISNIEPLKECKKLFMLYIGKCKNITNEHVEEMRKVIKNIAVNPM